MSFQNSYLATAPCFITFVAVIDPFIIFALNTSLFTFYITLCISSYSYTAILHVHMAMVEAQIYYPRYLIMIECS